MYEMLTKAYGNSAKSNTRVKVMLFDFNDIVYYEFLSQGQTINKKNYLQIQQSLRKAIRKKTLRYVKKQFMALVPRQCTCPAHTSLLVYEFLVKNNTVRIPQPPYSLDMAQCDFFYFLKLHKWKMADLPDCDCGHPSQTIHHIIKDCPHRAFKGSMRELHHATDEATNWIKALDIIL